MDQIINIYCDESCHLPDDQQKAMVLGALWCYKAQVTDLDIQIEKIMSKHGMPRHFEIKWCKVSAGQKSFYLDLVDFFFDTANLGFRGWVIPDKNILRHADFLQTHDDWYYKMYFYLLRNLIASSNKYHIYLDIKDTRSRAKLTKLHEVLASANYDFNRNIIEKMQHVHSHQVRLLQIADLLIGALSYKARNLNSNAGKLAIIEKIKQRSGLSLERNSLITEKKFDICFWRPNHVF